MTFERARPRSRVRIPSRNPSRVRKHLFQPITSLKQSRQTSATQQPGGGAVSQEYWANATQDGQLSQTPLLKHSVSDVSEASGYLTEPSEPSVDLDAFPLPPNNRKVLPLSNNEDRLQSSQTDGPSKEGRLEPHQPTTRLRDSQARHVRPELSSPYKVVNPGDENPSNDHQSQSPNKHSVDPLLVDAIVKTVIEQLRLNSVAGAQASTPKSTPPSLDRCKDSSRTSSQRQALNRFVRELQRYTDNVNAAGKLPISTSTPSKSSATLRTVSALLPYRQEFRAAGLAVTSRDQGQKASHVTIHSPGRPEYRKKIQPPLFPEVSGLDGKQDTLSLLSTEVDFADPNTVDVWRRALIERVPSRRHAYVLETEASSAAGCIPCLSSRHALQDKKEALADVGTTKRDIAEPALADTSRLKMQRWGFKSKRTKGLRPQGYALPQTQQHTVAAHDSHIRGDLGTERDAKLTEKDVQLFPPKVSTNIHSLRRQTQVRHGYCPPSLQHKPQAILNPPEGSGNNMRSPLDSSIKPWTKQVPQRLAQRQYQSLPLNRAKVSPAEPDSARPTPRAPSVSQTNIKLKRRPGRSNFAPKDKAAMAKLEIAQHDHGPWPYPGHGPTLRPRGSGSARRPPRIPSRKSSIRRIRPASKADLDYASIFDSDVLKGLCIATKAACDKATDEFLHEKTGVHIRHFLSELIQFDSLSKCQPRETGGERKSRRRSQARDLKYEIRKSRELERARTYQT